MRICIFGASSAHIDEFYIKAVEDLAEKMARRGHSLVFGAGATGAMGAAARGTKRGGGYIHGVIPEFFREEGVEKIYTECDELTYTKTMAERKTLMEDDAEAFIIVPGGIGTLEEFYEVLTLKQLGRHNKAMAIRLKLSCTRCRRKTLWPKSATICINTSPTPINSSTISRSTSL